MHDEPWSAPAPLPCSALRWSCDPASLGFETTADIEPIDEIIGQDSALDALRYGLTVNAKGQNIFVRGLAGTGRTRLVRQLLETLSPSSRDAPDQVLVHNFDAADRPRLLTLPRGAAEPFRDAMDEFARFIRTELAHTLQSAAVQQRRQIAEQQYEREMEEVTNPLEQSLEREGLVLGLAETGDTQRPVVVPVVDGEPRPPEALAAMLSSGAIEPDAHQALLDKVQKWTRKMQQTQERVALVHAAHRERMRSILQDEARTALSDRARAIATAHPEASEFVYEAVDDVVSRRLDSLDSLEAADFVELYRVNVLASRSAGSGKPMVIEMAPAVQTLLGTVDAPLTHDGSPRPPHLGVRAGSLVRADGGTLLLDARDLLSEPGAWKAVVRTLREGHVDLTPPEQPTTQRPPGVHPEPIPVDVKVVLIGDALVYHVLDSTDPDFSDLFMVLADFDDVIERDADGIRRYAGVLARIARDDRLPPFDAGAVACLIEHAARIAAREGMLTARLSRVADIAREAAFLARNGHDDEPAAVCAPHILEAVARTKKRAGLPGRRYRERIASGVICVHTEGTRIGQVNGMAVIHAGPLTYGFPTRITATIGPGTGGTVNIEREAELSGAIHTKGFYILGGLMRTLLRTRHPLAFDASVAFEQSYGGIDGDSASGAEVCCMLSALTRVPLRQDLAMSGAIDQVGNVLPVGAVNEKIEGFYDACVTAGLTGTQGVIIPRANQGDLMLRQDVVEACGAGRFHVYAVSRITEALGLFTDCDPGDADEEGHYPEGTLLALAVERARAYWEMVAPLQGR